MRSRAYTLAANGADATDIVAAFTPALIDHVETALEAAMLEMNPAAPADLVAHIGGVVGIVGQNWTRSGREEFTDIALNEFMTMPGGYVLDALARARRRVTDGRMLISWVADDVEPRQAKLRVEIENLTRIAQLATPTD